MKDLEQAVRKIIEEIYCAKYKGILRVEETFTDSHHNLPKCHLGYRLILGLNKDHAPVSLTMTGNKEQFLKFIKKELRHSHFDHVSYFTAEKMYFNNGCCER